MELFWRRSLKYHSRSWRGYDGNNVLWLTRFPGMSKEEAILSSLTTLGHLQKRMTGEAEKSGKENRISMDG